PHWTTDRLALVRAALDELHACPAPPNTHPVRETFAGWFGRWRTVEADPEPFLSLGLRSPAWLEERLPAITEAADAAPVDGRADGARVPGAPACRRSRLARPRALGLREMEQHAPAASARRDRLDHRLPRGGERDLAPVGRPGERGSPSDLAHRPALEREDGDG